jgi:hypothetical protein
MLTDAPSWAPHHDSHLKAMNTCSPRPSCRLPPCSPAWPPTESEAHTSASRHGCSSWPHSGGGHTQQQPGGQAAGAADGSRVVSQEGARPACEQGLCTQLTSLTLCCIPQRHKQHSHLVTTTVLFHSVRLSHTLACLCDCLLHLGARSHCQATVRQQWEYVTHTMSRLRDDCSTTTSVVVTFPAGKWKDTCMSQCAHAAPINLSSRRWRCPIAPPPVPNWGPD